MTIKFDKAFVLNDKEGNSLVFDDGTTLEDSVDMTIPLQTQIVED